MNHRQTKKLIDRILLEQKSKPKSLFKANDRIIFSETVSEKRLKEIAIVGMVTHVLEIPAPSGIATTIKHSKSF